MENHIGNTPSDIASGAPDEANFSQEKLKNIRRPSDSEVLRMIQEAEPNIDGSTTVMAVSLAHLTFRLAKRRLMGILDPATEMTYGQALGRRIMGAKKAGIPNKAVARGQIIANRIINSYIQSSLNNKQ